MTVTHLPQLQYNSKVQNDNFNKVVKEPESCSTIKNDLTSIKRNLIWEEFLEF